MVEVGSQLEHEKKKNSESEAQLAQEKERHKNELTCTKQQCDWYLERLANRFDEYNIEYTTSSSSFSLSSVFSLRLLLPLFLFLLSSAFFFSCSRVDKLSQIRTAGEAEKHEIPEHTELSKLLLDLRKQLEVMVVVTSGDG